MEEVIVKLYAEVLLAVLFTIGYLVLLVQKRQWYIWGRLRQANVNRLEKSKKELIV